MYLFLKATGFFEEFGNSLSHFPTARNDSIGMRKGFLGQAKIPIILLDRVLDFTPVWNQEISEIFQLFFRQVGDVGHHDDVIGVNRFNGIFPHLLLESSDIPLDVVLEFLVGQLGESFHVLETGKLPLDEYR